MTKQSEPRGETEKLEPLMENIILNSRKTGFWMRFTAIWLDILIICLLLKIVAIVLEQFGVFDNFEYLTTACMVAYLAVFIGGKGRTIGKILCGLTVRQTNNKTVGYLRGLLREVVGKLIAGIFFFLGFFWVGFSRSKRGWHDYIAHTMVIQDSKIIKRGRLILTIVLGINVLFISSIATFSFVNIRSLQKRNVSKPGAIDVGTLTKADVVALICYEIVLMCC